MIPRRALLLVLGALGLLLGWGCDRGDGLRHDPSSPRPALLRSAALDELVAGLLEEVESAGRRGDVPRGERTLLLSPFCAEPEAVTASALSWSLLRQREGLLPHLPRSEVGSTSALRGWLRREQPRATVVWALEVRNLDPWNVEVRLVIADAERSWRSQRRSAPSWSGRSAPFDAESVVARRQLPELEFLRLVEGEIFGETREGRIPLRVRDGRIEPRTLRAWAEFDRSWVEGREGREPVPVLARLSGRARIEMRFEDEGRRARFWMARGGSRAPLPLRWVEPTAVRSIVGIPHRQNEPARWLLLREGGQLELHEADLRLVPRAVRRAAQPSRPAPSVRVAIETVAGSLDPRARWEALHRGVPLLLWREGEARPEPGIVLRSKEQGRVWELDLPELRSRGGRPSIRSSHWANALRSRLDALAGREEMSWLVAPLRELRIEERSHGLRLAFPEPVRDLPARLADPALVLRDDRLALRFATHDPSLRPRVVGGCRPELVSLEASQARADLLLGTLQLWRPVPGQPVPASAAGLRELELGDTPVVLLLGAETPVAFGRRLRAALGHVTPFDLLALDDPRLRPIRPVGGDPFVPAESVVEGGAEFALLLATSTGSPVADDLRRAAERLEVLLRPAGIRVLRAGDAGSQAWPAAQRMVGVLTPLPLFGGDPLLRALELSALMGVPAGDDAPRLALTDPQRGARAQAIEDQLLASGRLHPLWTRPGRAWIDERVRGEGPLLPGLPPLLREARWVDLGSEDRP